MNDRRRAALDLAGLGLEVLILEPGGKAPLGRLVPHGFKDATSDKATISKWFKEEPDGNVGVACQPSGILTVDVDPRNGGDTTWEEFVRSAGSPPDSWEAITASGGRHICVLSHESEALYASRLGPGVDLKWQGYIVVAPSVLADGGQYEWREGHGPGEIDLAEVPEEWLDHILRGRDNGAAPVASDERTGLPIGARTLEAIAHGLPAPAEGQTHREVAVGVARNLRDAGTSYELALACLASALNHDEAQLGEQPWEEADAKKILDSVWDDAAPDAGKYLNKDSLAKRLTPFDLSAIWDEEDEPEWVIPGIFLSGKYHEFVGAMGSGKSLVVLGLIVTRIFPADLRAAYLDEENGPDEIKRRLRALGASREQVREQFVYLPDVMPSIKEAAQVVPLIADLGIDLAVFDSLADFYGAAGLDEDSNKDATTWSKAYPERLAHAHGIASVGIDHTGHKNEDRARGATAKGSKADATWMVEVESDFDAETIGKVRLKRGRKNRQGVLPDAHVLRIGGDGRGGISFQSITDHQAAEDKRREVARMKEFRDSVVALLKDAGDEGLTQRALVDALRDAEVTGSTKWMNDKLKEYVESPGIPVALRQEGQKRVYYHKPSTKKHQEEA